MTSVSRSFISGEYLPAQKKVLPGTRSRPGEVDAARWQQFGVFVGEIVAHHGDDFRLRKKAGGERDVGAGAAQHAIDFSVRGFDSIVCDGANDDHGHSFDCTSQPLPRGRGSVQPGLVGSGNQLLQLGSDVEKFVEIGRLGNVARNVEAFEAGVIAR